MFRSLHTRNYRLFFVGGLISNTGVWMQRTAQSWIVLVLSGGNGFALGSATFLQFAPVLLLSIPAGILSDRFSKINLLVVTQALMGGVSAVMAVLDATGVLALPHVYLLAAVLGVITALDAPARQSFVSELVGLDHVVNAIGLNSASFNVARLLGPAVAGLVIGHLATWVLFAAHALSSVAIVSSLLRLDRTSLFEVRRSSTVRGQVVEGFRYLGRTPVLILFVACASLLSAVGLNSLQVVLPLVATQTFQVGAVGFGLLTASLAVGSLLGALLSGRAVGIPRRRWVFGTAIGFGASQMVVSVIPVYPGFAVGLAVSGLLFMSFVVAVNTSVQLTAAVEMRSRVVAAYMMFFLGGGALGAPVLGLVADQLGPRTTICCAGAVGVLVGGGCALLLFLGGRRRARSAVVVTGATGAPSTSVGH
ncbi:MFS transporter [Desertihabitans aurantiacus]|uniref:MFS transporter n=1 Tax=Desertihabitans aurantiacus TaxID=2282477 RepID=UPI000DF85D5F|nr:MFS transporter [Desertihabitans aurantiacus]